MIMALTLRGTLNFAHARGSYQELATWRAAQTQQQDEDMV